MPEYYKRIRELREDNDLTQKQVAERLDQHLTTYQRWESGLREVPTHIVVLLCYLYNVSSDYLLEITDEYTVKPAKRKKPSK